MAPSLTSSWAARVVRPGGRITNQHPPRWPESDHPYEHNSWPPELRRIGGEPRRSSACGGIRHHVYYSRPAALGGPSKCRADFVRVLDVLAMAAERLGDEVEAGVAEVAARLGPVGSGPAPVVAHDRHDVDPVSHGRVQLHRIEAHRAVAVEHEDLTVRARHLGAQAERQADTHSAERTGVQTVSGKVRGNRLAAKIQDFLAVYAQDGV